MNPHERELEYPLADTLPRPGRLLEVAPGVSWVRMPLPFALDHVNLYLLRDRFEGRNGWTLIDCGISSQATRELWQQIFDEGLEGLPIVRVLCTHMHPDHVGLAYMITERFGAPLWMTVGEYAIGRVMSSNLPGADGESAVAHFRRHGLADESALEAIGARGGRYFRSLVPEMPTSFRRIRGGEIIRIGERDWRVIIGLGHSPEHASLYCDGATGEGGTDEAATGEGGPMMLSGDMVLPRISTNVSVFDIEPEADPVTWFLDSLRRFEECDPDTLVFPSHGRPFRKLHVRLRQLRDHHAERLEVVLQACRQRPLSAADALPIMFAREFDTHQMTFAMGETLAHLHALWLGGKLRREIGQDGVARFSANSPSSTD
ncbi:MAG: MBL fold metallo-hydrolase [Gammaproteobacteria bacterium]